MGGGTKTKRKSFKMNDKPHYVSALDVEEWATKCINLERERDELQDALEHAKMTISSIVSPSDKSTLELIKVTKERDEAREDLSAMADIAFNHLTSLLRGAAGEEETQEVLAALKLWKEMNQ